MAYIFLRSDDKKDWEKALRKLTIENERLKRQLIRSEFKVKKAKEPTLNELKKKAWRLYSRFRRQSEADKDGNLKCYTCSHVGPWKTFQIGHYHHGKADHDERNTRPQCVSCNHFKSGNLAVYGAKLMSEIGPEEMAKLDFDCHQEFKPTREYYQSLIEKYNVKI